MECPSDRYEELEPLCPEGHVLLVRDREDGQLYVKKRVASHAPEVYRQLMDQPAPGTPAIYAVYQDDEAQSLVIIEEYLPGRTLAEHLMEEGPFSEADTIRIGLALCDILKDLHSRRPAIIHRDIKPANVMRLPDGSVRLLDFSAAKLEAPRESRDTVLIGTAGFAAPEQYGFSASTVQTDIYAMGVLLSTLRTGVLPWEKRAVGKLRPVIDRCMRIDPKDRYIDARDLRAALKQASRRRIEWLPPGFRGLKWYRMIPALGYYLFFLYLFLMVPLAVKDGISVAASKIVCFHLGLGPVAFYCNYLDVQRFFPFMRSPSRGLRVLGMVLFPLWLWVMMVLWVIFVLEFYP